MRSAERADEVCCSCRSDFTHEDYASSLGGSLSLSVSLEWSRLIGRMRAAKKSIRCWLQKLRKSPKKAKEERKERNESHRWSNDHLHSDLICNHAAMLTRAWSIGGFGRWSIMRPSFMTLQWLSVFANTSYTMHGKMVDTDPEASQQVQSNESDLAKYTLPDSHNYLTIAVF